MAASISAVAAICAKAPSITQGQNSAPGRGSGVPVGDEEAGDEHERERKTEQKPHMGRADGAEAAGQLALRRIAQRLGEGGDDREDGPEPGRDHHPGFSATTM